LHSLWFNIWYINTTANYHCNLSHWFWVQNRSYTSRIFLKLSHSDIYQNDRIDVCQHGSELYSEKRRRYRFCVDEKMEANVWIWYYFRSFEYIFKENLWIFMLNQFHYFNNLFYFSMNWDSNHLCLRVGTQHNIWFGEAFIQDL
jgi:hypothetical protein